MIINGTSFNVEAVVLLSFDEFKKQHENLPYYRRLKVSERNKELKSVFVKLGGSLKLK